MEIHSHSQVTYLHNVGMHWLVLDHSQLPVTVLALQRITLSGAKHVHMLAVHDKLAPPMAFDKLCRLTSLS